MNDTKGDRTLTGFLLPRYTRYRLGISPATVEQYSYAVRAYGRFLGRPPTLADLDRDTILSWLSTRSAERSPRTVKRERASLLTLWRYAAEEGLVEPPVRIPCVKIIREIPTAWNLDEFEQIISTTRRLAGEMRGLPIRRADWWTSLLLGCYWVGTRISALLAVRTADVCLQRRLMVLRAADAKTGVAQVVNLHDQCMAAIASHHCLHREFVWPYPYNRRQLHPQLKAILKSAGLPHDRTHMFHCFRRTCYSLSWANGSAEIARAQLGHKTDLSASYLDPRVARLPQAADVLPVPHIQ